MIHVGDLVLYVHPDEPWSGSLGTVIEIEEIDEPDWYTGPYYRVELLHGDREGGTKHSVIPIFNAEGQRITHEWLSDYEANFYDMEGQ